MSDETCESMPCPNCGHEFPWDTYYAGKVLQCVACDRRFLSASPQTGQGLLLPADATPRGVITLDALASRDREFADMAGAWPAEEGGPFALTVHASTKRGETCTVCGASVLAGIAVCGQCGLNPRTGEEVPGLPPSVWAVRRQPKSRMAIFFQRLRILFARVKRSCRRSR